MLTTRRIGSLVVAVLAVLGVGIGSPSPAFASTLTVNSLNCETRYVGVWCEAYVSGGTPQYSYSWYPARQSSYDSAGYSSGVISCGPGYSITVYFTVQDSLGATASRTLNIYCSGKID